MLKIKKTAKSIILAIVTVVLSFSFGLNQLSAETLEEVDKLLLKAEQGDSVALDEAFEILEMLTLEQPENAKVLAFLGSAYGLRAAQSWNPLQKGRFGNLSLRNLDIALEMAPDDADVRRLRALVNLNVPFFLARKDDGIEDLIVLDRLFRESPTPELAKLMLYFKFYDILTEEAADRGDWSVGKSLAEKLAQ